MNQSEKRVDARNNKAQIVTVASSLFQNHGVEAVSMQKLLNKQVLVLAHFIVILRINLYYV